MPEIIIVTKHAGVSAMDPVAEFEVVERDMSRPDGHRTVSLATFAKRHDAQQYARQQEARIRAGAHGVCPHCGIDAPQHEFHCVRNGGTLDLTQAAG